MHEAWVGGSFQLLSFRSTRPSPSVQIMQHALAPLPPPARCPEEAAGHDPPELATSYADAARAASAIYRGAHSYCSVSWQRRRTLRLRAIGRWRLRVQKPSSKSAWTPHHVRCAHLHSIRGERYLLMESAAAQREGGSMSAHGMCVERVV